jgi:hypothetical protein
MGVMAPVINIYLLQRLKSPESECVMPWIFDVPLGSALEKELAE